MTGTRLPLYVDAVRHMRARQVLGRGRRLVPPAVLALGLPAAGEPAFTSHAAGLGASPAPQFGPLPDPADDGAFVALGHRRVVSGPGLWEPGAEGLLFAFHLHGFAPLATYAAGPRSAAHDRFWAGIVESWLETQSAARAPAWHPYPTSLRLIAWCSALGAISAWGPALRRRLAGEVARQARYLRRSVEHDVGGNHVVKNATALVFAGVTVPSCDLLPFAMRLLERELQRQILPDGGHEERSTSYHREVAHDLVDISELLQRAGRRVPEWLMDSVQRAQAWGDAMTGPDNRLPMLNDAWEGPPLARQRGQSPPTTVLPDTGYVVLRQGEDQAVLDCGRLCPDDLPAHAHADALSFVLWLNGELIVADPGAYTYGGPQRGAFRATGAHATAEVDGQDQCVFWGDFRASYLPAVQTPAVRRADGAVVVESAHDGYSRLDDASIHHRAFVWIPGSGMVVVDRLACKTSHAVRSSLPLSRAVRYESGHAGDASLSPLTGSQTVREDVSGYSPFLGEYQPTLTLRENRTVEPGEGFGWRLLRAGCDARLVDHHILEVTRDGGDEPARIPLRSIG